MKKSFRNFLLLTTSISVIATLILAVIEYFIGAANLFIGAVSLVLIIGTILPIANIIKQ